MAALCGAWLGLMSRFQEKVASTLGSVGYNSARRPWTTLGVCLAVSLLCGAGLVRLEVETDGDFLWTEQKSPAFMRRIHVREQWGEEPVAVRILIQAKETGQNALTVGAFREAFDLVDEVMALDSPAGLFRELCMKDPAGGCFVPGALRFFHTNRTLFEAQATSDSVVLAAASSDRFPDNGQRVVRTDIFGGFETDGSAIASCPVWRLDFVTDADKSVGVSDWEKAVIDSLVDSSYEGVEQRWEHIHVEIWSTGRSLDDELQRTVGGDITFMVISYNFLVAACALMLGHPLRCVRGRKILGACDFFLVIFAVVAGYGVSSALGVPFTSLQQILPFILVGIGVDDAYVLAGAFDRTDRKQPVEDRIREAMQLEGMSVTLTSFTDIVAFLCGASANFPAVSYFCVYAAASLVFIYTFHITAFCAMLALDARRQEAGRLDVMCCVQSKCDEASSQEVEEESLAVQLMVRVCKAITSHILVKLAIICVFLSFAGVCLWQAIEKTDTSFNIMDLAPDNSYMRTFLETEITYWGADSTGLHLDTHLFFNDLEHSDAAIQAEINETEEKFVALSCVADDTGISSWHQQFTKWTRDNKNSAPAALWTASDFAVSGGHEFLSGPKFYPALRYWLADCMLGCRFQDDIQFSGDSSIANSRSLAWQVTLSHSDKMAECLTEVEDFNHEREKALPGTFAWAPIHIFYHQYRMIRVELLWTTSMCFVAVLFVSLVIISHPVAVMLIFGVIFLVFVDLQGCVPIAGVSLNSISMINLVMAIGLVVDYSMHIMHSFMSQDPKLSRDERTVLAMKQMGVSVAKGIFSTLIAIMPLAFASSEVFRVFFKLFLAILIVGGSHGLVLMPVLLSLVGPTSFAHGASKESSVGKSPEGHVKVEDC